MANQMNQKVVITTAGNFTYTADDAVKKGQGTNVAIALEQARDVESANADGTEITFIPFEAIDHAVITKTMTTVEDPKDDMCPDPTPTPPTP